MDIGILALKFYDYTSYIRGFSKGTIGIYRCCINYYMRIANITQIEQITEKNVPEFFLYGRTERHWRSNSFITFPEI